MHGLFGPSGFCGTLTPGRRVFLIAYGSPAELEFLELFIRALKAVPARLSERPARSART
jgi:hypothetical protein